MSKKIAVSAQGEGLDAEVDMRFGRCEYFVICDEQEKEVTSRKNAGKESLEGAGVQAAQLLLREGVDAVLTGNIGPRAIYTLKAGGIRVYTGISGTVRDALASYRRGELKELTEANVSPHHGMQGR